MVERLLCIVSALSVASVGSPAYVSSPAPVGTTLIEAEGKASIEVVPDYAEFWLRYSAQPTTLAEGAAVVAQLEPRVRKELESLELEPKDIEFSGIMIPSVQDREVRASVRLRFSVVGLATAEDGSARYAKLCDQVRRIAESVTCSVEGPQLLAENVKPTEQQAIQRAVENAYPHGEAVASVLKAQIVAVDKIRVDKVTWGEEPDGPKLPSTLRSIVCTARVIVWYAYVPV